MTTLPKGVDVPGGFLRIRFTYKGVRCAEILSGLKPTKHNIAHAANKLSVIKLEIRENRFNYSQHFPNSARAAMFGGSSSTTKTVKEGVLHWLEVKKATVAPSGYNKYEKDAHKHVIPKWGARKFNDITRSEIRRWQTIELPTQDLANKTINCIMTPLRGAFEDAHADGVIQANPMATIKNLELDTQGEPDPLSLEELERITSLDTYREQEINAIGFNAWAGLREGELLALAWEDIDLTNWTVRVTRNRVNNEYKLPKTKASIREFDLLPEAIDFLKRQKKHTFMLPAQDIEVRQRNNRSFAKEQVRFVFHSSAAHKPWAGDSSFRTVWTGLLKQAKVRHRGPNQLRHTFISQMLTQYIPPEWIAPMCGTSVEMIKKHYGKFIREDRPNLGEAIAKIRDRGDEKRSQNGHANHRHTSN
jgi:integrase